MVNTKSVLKNVTLAGSVALCLAGSQASANIVRETSPQTVRIPTLNQPGGDQAPLRRVRQATTKACIGGPSLNPMVFSFHGARKCVRQASIDRPVVAAMTTR